MAHERVPEVSIHGDPAFRAEANAELARMNEAEYARVMVKGINEHGNILVNAAVDRASAEELASPGQLSSWDWDRSDLGKIYKARGTIIRVEDSSDDPLIAEYYSEHAFIEIDGHEDPLDPAHVGLRHLNNVQKKFLELFCSYGDVCRGTFYLKIAGDPDFIETELLSAELDPVTLEGILELIAR